MKIESLGTLDKDFKIEIEYFDEDNFLVENNDEVNPVQYIGFIFTSAYHLDENRNDVFKGYDMIPFEIEIKVSFDSEIESVDDIYEIYEEFIKECLEEPFTKFKDE